MRSFAACAARRWNGLTTWGLVRRGWDARGACYNPTITHKASRCAITFVSPLLPPFWRSPLRPTRKPCRRRPKDHFRRRHHRVRLAQRASRPAFPDASKPEVTVNITYMVGSRHEGYGETGMAHLLEHMTVSEDQRRPGHQEGISRPRRRFQRLHQLGPHQLLRNREGHDENLRWAVGLEADRMVNMRIEKQLLDTEMTVVRNEFEMRREQPGRHAAGARAGDRLPVAQLRQDRPSATAPTSKTCRSSGWPRSTTSTTSRTTPC